MSANLRIKSKFRRIAHAAGCRPAAQLPPRHFGTEPLWDTWLAGCTYYAPVNQADYPSVKLWIVYPNGCIMEIHHNRRAVPVPPIITQKFLRALVAQGKLQQTDAEGRPLDPRPAA